MQLLRTSTKKLRGLLWQKLTLRNLPQTVVMTWMLLFNKWLEKKLTMLKKIAIYRDTDHEKYDEIFDEIQDHWQDVYYDVIHAEL